LKFIIKNLSTERGITLVEIIVVILIIALFSMILISDFPKIQRQSALSRVTYKLAQDLRKAQDLGLSGVLIKDSQNNPIMAVGYGVYINLDQSTTKYIIYADVKTDSIANAYSGNFSTPLFCSSTASPASDCVIEIIDVSKEDSSLSIKPFTNIDGNSTSINFSPPDPTITIANLVSSSSQIAITLGNTDGATRKVWVNTSGLINVQ
jgi:type II secretory pathway pseudopilin PulG